MNQSACVVLPVSDASCPLRNRVLDILEVMSELTGGVEVLIVSFGSDDDAGELAMALAREYPQVRHVDRPETNDYLQAVEDGIFASRADMIFVHDPSSPFSQSSLRSLWEIRDDEETVVAQSRVDASVDRIPVETDRLAARSPWSGSIQMIRRSAIQELSRRLPRRPLVAVERFTRTDLSRFDQNEDPYQPNLVNRLRRMITG